MQENSHPADLFSGGVDTAGRRRGDGDDSAPHRTRELATLVAEAERLVAAGRHEEALHVAQVGLKKFPTAGRLRAVIQYVRRAGANKRLLQLKQILDERKDERAYRDLIVLHLELRNKDAAQEIATRYLQEFPDQAEAHLHRAEVYLACYFGELFARDAKHAVESLERALELNPETIRAHVLLALLYFAIGAPRHSANQLGEVLRLDPGNSTTAEFRSQVLEAAGPEGEEDIEHLLDYAEWMQRHPEVLRLFQFGG